MFDGRRFSSPAQRAVDRGGRSETAVREKEKDFNQHEPGHLRRRYSRVGCWSTADRLTEPNDSGGGAGDPAASAKAEPGSGARITLGNKYENIFAEKSLQQTDSGLLGCLVFG